MKTLGVTGTSGSGKSLFCAFLRGLGAAVIDCDEVYHELLNSSVLLNSDILALFPEVEKNGFADRKALSRIVFADKMRLKQLESTVFPHITAEIWQTLEALAREGTDIAVLDAPTLFESGADALCDRIVAVCSPVEAQIERLHSREGLPREDALKRINSRPPDTFYIEKGCEMVYNDDGIEKIRNKAERICMSLRDE